MSQTYEIKASLFYLKYSRNRGKGKLQTAIYLAINENLTFLKTRILGIKQFF